MYQVRSLIFRIYMQYAILCKSYLNPQRDPGGWRSRFNFIVLEGNAQNYAFYRRSATDPARFIEQRQRTCRPILKK